MIDRTRVAHPKNKPRVERVVSYVRESSFKGEDFKDLSGAQRRAPKWCFTKRG